MGRADREAEAEAEAEAWAAAAEGGGGMATRLLRLSRAVGSLGRGGLRGPLGVGRRLSPRCWLQINSENGVFFLGPVSDRDTPTPTPHPATSY